MDLHYSIDWLAFTDPCLEPLSKVLDFSWSEPDLRGGVPLRGYNRTMSLRAGRVDWHSERQQQRRLWTLTGQDLDKIRNSGFAGERIVRAVNGIYDVHVSRVDFAVDVKNAGASPGDIVAAWDKGEIRTAARTMRQVEGRDKHGKGTGHTVYIGARSSCAFLRVYDKAAEQGIDGDWTRIELECKRPLGGKVLAEMDRIGIAPAGTAAIKKFVHAPGVDWYSDALSGAGRVDLTTPRKRTNWEKWVYEVALPNVVRALKEDVPGVREALEPFV